MKILVVCQYYYPEPFRIHEVCEEFVRRGNEVTVLTGLPNYPMGIIPEEYKGKEHRDEIVNGVHVIRVNEIPRTKGKVGLAKNYVSYTFNASLKALSMKKDFDVIFVYQLSPVLMAIPAYVAKWFSKCKKVKIYCLDLWPESLSSLGIGRDSMFFKFMKWVSIRIYKGADAIGYTSKGFEKYFRTYLKVNCENFMYIPQFADDLFSSMDKEDVPKNEKNEAGNREEVETVNYVFAGNIGEMQSVDTIIKAAALTENDAIRWHIVGDGFALDSCKELCDRMNLNDKVTFYGRLPVEQMPRFYKMADAMIVTLCDNDTISYTLPGKIQSYMAAGKPIIAAAGGETKRLIEEAECGMCASAENENEFAAIADKMAQSDLKRFGMNSQNYYEKYFSKSSHVDLLEELLS